MAETGKNVELAGQLLLQGRLVAIPTETVYGLAANALDENAVLSIFEAKRRPFFDPLIIHVDGIEAAEKYASLPDERLIRLAEKFWPGPITILLPKKNNVPGIVNSGLEQVAVRVPDHQLTLQLLSLIKVPLAAPSANPFGYVSPTEPAHVEKQLGNKVSYILDGGRCSVGLESTIAGVEDGELCIYRLGGLTLDEIEKVAGKTTLRINNSSDPKAPGQLKNHYAPRKPLYLGDLDELINEWKSMKTAVILFGNRIVHSPGAEVFNLSGSGNLAEAAVNLFKVLRQTDESNADVVLCEMLPDIGLGLAINDRLRRASIR